MEGSGKQTWTKTFPATIAGLGEATEFLSRTLEASGRCPMPVVTSLMVAHDEIGSNIVHYSGAPDFTLEIELLDDAVGASVTFSDAGTPYDPLKRVDPDVSLPVEDRAIGGLGLLMVKKMNDDVTYAHRDGRNILTVTKRFHPKQPAS